MLGAGLTIHLYIRKHWISVRAIPRHGKTVQVEGMARIAMRSGKDKAKVLAVGDEVATLTDVEDVVIYDAFCHPRVLVGGFDAAALVVREFIRRSRGGKTPLLRFRMFVYLLDELEGGLTDVEERTLIELGLRIGAWSVTVCAQPAE